MDAGGGQGDEHVAGDHGGVVDDLGLVHHAHGEARQIVVVSGHHARVFGGLAADEGAACLDAALRHAGDDVCYLLRDVLADGNVVQEENGLGAAADDVVDAHGHAVDAHGVVLVQQLGDAQLGAHAVGAGDQHRLFHTGKVRGEESAEASNVGDHAGDQRALHVLAHELDALIACFNINAGGGVGRGVGVFHVDALQFLKIGDRGRRPQRGHSFPVQQ